MAWFRRIRLFQLITPSELLSYNYGKHRRILVIDAGQLEKAFDEDLKYSRKLNYQEWNSRPWSEKILGLFTIPIKEQYKRRCVRRDILGVLLQP